ncbi:MAG TPA: hypothetical protein VN726_16425 [Hanamia sp.]|nr:hypothetical protein [Hanamia sp.]
MRRNQTVKLLIISIFLFSANRLPAQKLMNSAGLSLSVLQGTLHQGTGYETFAIEQNNLTWFPRYNFIESENSSVSIGAPVGAGIGLVTNTIGGDAGILFSYDVPVVIDYNIGCKSTVDNDRTFGGYFGAGFGYNKVIISGSSYSDFNGASYGPLIRAGFRFGSANENWNGHAITAGVYYKMGLERDKLHTIGFNVLIDF